MHSMSEQQQIRILQLGGDALEAERVCSQLINCKSLAGEIHIRRVADEATYLSLLEAFAPDLVLAAWDDADFSARRALALLRQCDHQLPFICWAASASEREVNEAMVAGATDYVCKRTPALLIPAVKRAWHEIKELRVQEGLNHALLRAQRFESLAILAGTLSHDLRNMLQPLMLVSESLRNQYSSDENLCKLGNLIGDCSRRSLDMLNSMLDFARGIDRTGRIRPDQLFSNAGHLLRAVLCDQMQLEFSALAPEAVFLGNQTELQQCLVNLGLNASQAKPEGQKGLLWIKAEECELAPGFFLPGEQALPGPYLCISVVDNSGGMTPEVMARLFEPFFTTKSSGTGLGLCSCLRIVTDHGGVIRVETHLGVGTCFYLYFPLLRQALAHDAASSTRVLLVDGGNFPEPQLLANELSEAGYQVELLPCDKAALQWRSKQRVPDLIVIDAASRLPNGQAALQDLHQRGYRGAVLALGCSQVQEPLPSWSGLQKLSKPVRLANLLQIVYSSLVKLTRNR